MIVFNFSTLFLYKNNLYYRTSLQTQNIFMLPWAWCLWLLRASS